MIKSRLMRSLIVFSANCTAASAMSPTVAAFEPESKAYTGSGSVSSIRCTPAAKAYMPNAPGKLEIVRIAREGLDTYTPP